MTERYLTICEYALITQQQDCASTMHAINPVTFSWLCQQQENRRPLFTYRQAEIIQWQNYVGYLEAPNGEGLEILPKTEISKLSHRDPELRHLLQNMLRVSLGLKPIQGQSASLQQQEMPIHEWIFAQFLHALHELVCRGLHFDYHTVADVKPFLRGKLNINQQIRQTPDKATQFHIRYHQFNANNIENRLIKTALYNLYCATQYAEHRRLANKLLQYMDAVPLSTHPLREWRQWRRSRLLAYYQPIKPWCQIILEALNPHFQKGEHRGISMLFAMEQLYETYLDYALRHNLQQEYHCQSQSSEHALLQHTPTDSNAQQWFRLKPDFVITHQPSGKRYILDAKWKLLNANNSRDKYHISQSDLYQLYAYGQKYLDGKGDMMLIYPQHTNFTQALPPFYFNKTLRLWCVPFDLYSGLLTLPKENSIWQDVLTHKQGK